MNKMTNCIEKKWMLPLFSLFFLFIGFLTGYIFGWIQEPSKHEIDTLIFPGDKLKLINELESAQYEIDIEMYQFTSKEIADKLIFISNRNVTVKVILEKRIMGGKSQEMYEYLLANNISVRYANNKEFARTHSKLIIIDNSTIIIGSVNLSNAALEKNRELAVILKDKTLASIFKKIFDFDYSIANLALFFPFLINRKLK